MTLPAPSVAPVVYVNYGTPEDYAELDTLGVSVEGPVHGRAELADPDGHPINLVEMEHE